MQKTNKYLFEGMFDNDNEEETLDNTSLSSSELLKPIENLNQINKEFDKVYTEMVNTTEDSIYSTKIRNFEINDMVNKMTKARKDLNLPNEEDLQLDDEKYINELLNSKNNSLLKNSNDFSVPQERKKRYELYEEIPNINSICYRMLRVYLDNIFIKNLQTNQFLNIIDNTDNVNFNKNNDKSIIKGYKEILKTIIIYFDYQKKLKDEIIPKTLTYGNYFIEVINLELINKIQEHPMLLENSMVLNESANLEVYSDSTKSKNSKYTKLDTSFIVLENYFDFEIGQNTEEMIEILEENKTRTKDSVQNKRKEKLLEEDGKFFNNANEYSIYRLNKLEKKIKQIQESDAPNTLEESKKLYEKMVDESKKLNKKIILENKRITDNYSRAELLEENNLRRASKKELLIIKPLIKIEEITMEKDKLSLILECKKEFENSTSKIRELNEGEIPGEILNEDRLLEEQHDFLKGLLKNKTQGLVEEFDLNFLNDITENDEKEYNYSDLANIDLTNLQNIYLKTLSPNNVIIIKHDGILLGYLVVEDLEVIGNSEEINVFKRFSENGNSSGVTGKSSTKNDEKINTELVDNISKSLTKNLSEIVRKSGRYSSLFNTESNVISDDVDNSIKILLYNHLKKKSRLKFRFLSNNHLVNFSGNIDKYAPYGTSIFDPVVLPVKMYTLALMSSIVSRLSRASVVRKWNVEVGNKKNHSQILNKLKSDIKNQSISFDKLSNIKNMPNVITDFRDMATVQMNGNKFIDMEIMPMNDRSLPLNDMQELRNELVTSTGVPSVYLNIGDAVDLRETLVNLNTTFAGNIISHQSSIEDSSNHLINIIFKFLLKSNGYKDSLFNLSNYHKLSFNPPLVLQIQANEAIISSVSNIISMFSQTQVQIDPMYFFKLYIPQLNWDLIEKSGLDFITKNIKNNIINNEQG